MKGRTHRLRSMMILGVILSVFTAMTQPVTTVDQLKTLGFDQLDSIVIAPATVIGYTSMTDYAIELVTDSLDEEKSMKGEILLSAISTQLGNAIRQGMIDPDEPDVQRLIATYKQYNYHFYQPRPSDIQKLMQYACAGEYGYIYKRLSQERYFYPIMALAIIGLLFSIANLLRWVKWPYRRGWNWFFVSALTTLLVAYLVFRQRCGG